jgi:hypothetical protein
LRNIRTWLPTRERERYYTIIDILSDDNIQGNPEISGQISFSSGNKNIIFEPKIGAV